MANRTYNRRPYSVTTYRDDLPQETFANFTQFTGLNTNKNYTTIDQNSFADVNNMYVDQNNQLSTRPPLKSILVGGLQATDKILEIVKINNLLIYHYQREGSGYYLGFTMKGKWYPLAVGSDVKVMWFDDKYVIFQPNSISAFAYDYEKDDIVLYTADKLVYEPITKIVYGGNIDELGQTAEAPNIFTTVSVTRYIFDRLVETDQRELVGKNVTFTLPNVVDANGDLIEFSLTWVANNDTVFIEPLGVIQADEIQASSVGTFLAYKNSDNNFCYYSINGDVFLQISLPEVGTATKAFRISDTGDCIVYVPRTDGSTEDFHIYVVLVNAENVGAWSTLTVDFTQNCEMNAYYENQNLSTNFVSTKITVNSLGVPSNYKTKFVLAVNDVNHAVLLIGCNITKEDWANNTRTYSETGTKVNVSQSGECLITLSTVNGLITATHYVEAPTDFLINFCYGRLSVQNNHSVLLLLRIDETATTRLQHRFFHFNENFVPFFMIYGSNSSSTGNNSTSIILYTGTSYRTITVSDLNTDNVSVYNSDLAFILVPENEGLPSFKSRFFDAMGYSDISVCDGIVNFTGRFAYNSDYDPALYVYKFTFSSDNGTAFDQDVERGTYPIYVDNAVSSFSVINNNTSVYHRLDYYNEVYLTEKYFYNGTPIDLLNIGNVLPIYVSEDTFYIQRISDNRLFTNNYTGQISVDYRGEGKIVYHYPELTENFVTPVITLKNKLYWASLRDGKVYFPDIDVVSFEDEPTALVVFNQTSLGVFLEDKVYELQYNDMLYYLYPTKLQLGNKRGSDVLLNYDGQSIFVTTLKGLSSLNYQDFVQSTEQVYTYLTENIMDDYDAYYGSPIKLYQYKDWLFMYRTDINYIFVFDVRTASWWKWANFAPIQQIVYDDDKLEVLANERLYNYDFKSDDFRDDIDNVIPWTFTSQKMHFGYPSNYKHIRSLTVFNSQELESLRYKMAFKNYRNLFNSKSDDTVEYEINLVQDVKKRWVQDLIESEEQTGVAITGKDTLNNAKVSVLVESKNLFDYNSKNINETTKIANGFRITGYSCSEDPANNPYFKSGVSYTISYKSKTVGQSPNTALFGKVAIYNFTKGKFLYLPIESGTTFTIPDEDNGDLIGYVLYGSSIAPVSENYAEITNIQIEQGTEATEYTPYVTDGTSVNVTACGRNVLYTADGTVQNGDYVVSANNGEITFTRGETYVGIWKISNEIGWSTTGNYINDWKDETVYGGSAPLVLSWSYEGNIDRTGSELYPRIVPIYKDGTANDQIQVFARNSITLEAKPIAAIALFMSDTTPDGWKIKVQLSKTATPYTPYTGAAYPATVGQSVEITQFKGTTTIFSDTNGVLLTTKFVSEQWHEEKEATNEETLTPMIKRVNFIKTNAFQFTFSNDATDPDPKPFITSNIAIKYRITERLR